MFLFAGQLLWLYSNSLKWEAAVFGALQCVPQFGQARNSSVTQTPLSLLPGLISKCQCTVQLFHAWAVGHTVMAV